MSDRPLSPTSRTRLRRYPHRGRTDRADLYDVLDAGLVCYVGAVVDGSPHVIPMAYGRIDDTLYLHGSTLNQALAAARDGGELCVTVTHIDALVLANTLYHHSVNFRSAVVYGQARVVTDEAERVAAFRATGEQLVPGRAATLRAPSAKELSAVLMVALSLDEASVKVREGGPFHEPAEDAGIWAGVVPIAHTWGVPSSAPEAQVGTVGGEVPEHVSRLTGRPVQGRRS